MSDLLLGFDVLGESAPSVQLTRPDARSVSDIAIPIAAGVIGSSFWRAHPVLGFLGGIALGQAGQDAARGKVGIAAARLGVSGTAIAGSLLWRRHPVLGHIGGLVLGTAAATAALKR